VRSIGIAWLGALAVAVVVAGTTAEDQRKQYEADVPKTILELQQFRQSNSAPIKSGSGREGVATLVNLNPTIETWYLLRIAWKDGVAEPASHLENPKPHEAHLILDERYPAGIVVQAGNDRHPCELFGSGSGSVGSLEQARQSKLAYVPLCEGRVYLRNPVQGHSTTLESAVDFLRDRVWGGEQVITVFHHLLADRYRETGALGTYTPASLRANAGGTLAGQPLAAIIDPRYADRLVVPRGLGIVLRGEGPEKNGMIPGAWYEGANPGTWVSIIQPDVIAPSILRSYETIVNTLDGVEAASLCYLIAFDLDHFELGYELGTDHPRVNWSDRVAEPMRNPRLPGPDGINAITPLASVGRIRPDIVTKTVASFIGGFKRMHGAFKFGDLARRNHGSHYGFIENGVVFSKLQPGLATVFVLDDGSVGMKTWTEIDNALLARIRHARQNGVPLIEATDAARDGAKSDAGSQAPVPGSLVNNWGAGNWSGSEDDKLRTMRAGLSLQTSHGKRFLIYAVFSDATPSAMARVFQSYRTNYAMLLDMNALEHTYLAVYRRSGGELAVDHLLTGMSELDRVPSGELVPRFLGYSDNRDFFYLVRKDAPQDRP
jgi:hypothetical protein